MGVFPASFKTLRGIGSRRRLLKIKEAKDGKEKR
jgi:hypothetical protein